VIFVTAHLRDHSEPDWRALAATRMTLAIYMGMSRIETLCATLAQALCSETPAAVVQWAGTANERRVTGTFGTIAAAATQAELGSPAIILVGDAIGEAVTLAAFDAQVSLLRSA
jgi:uroporphyrin-III C-methyltransferase